MDWVIDVIDTNETFGKDPFYRAEARVVGEWNSGGITLGTILVL